MADRPEVTQEQIAAGLRELGVAPGAVLLVHSSLSRFGRVVGGAEAVIEALLAAVGPEGTVTVPTHTWNRIGAKEPVFDVRRTPGCVGRIPEVFRGRPDALRSLHPTHSCAAIGPLREALLIDHEKDVTPCGRRSPYQRLMAIGGKIVFLGVTLYVNTSFHATEEMACVPWVLDRFEMLYTVDYEGRKIAVPSRRHADGVERAFEAMEPILEREGVLRSGTIGAATVRVVDAAGMAAVMLPMLARDPFALLAPGVRERERDAFRRCVEARPRRRR